jgi:hypothetical protein
MFFFTPPGKKEHAQGLSRPGFLTLRMSFFALRGKKRHTNRTYAVGAASLRQRGTLFSIVYGFSARSAEKPYTQRLARTLLPHAKTWRCDAE